MAAWNSPRVAASSSRQQRRIRALLAAALLVLGRVLDTQSITALRDANQAVRHALEALDPFVVARDFYDRLLSCRHDWRLRCLCNVSVFASESAIGCVRSQPLWPFNWIDRIKFWLVLIIAKVPGIPDAVLYAAKQIATKGPVAVGLGLLTAGATAFAVADTMKPGSDELFEKIQSLVIAILLIPVLTGLLVFMQVAVSVHHLGIRRDAVGADLWHLVAADRQGGPELL